VLPSGPSVPKAIPLVFRASAAIVFLVMLIDAHVDLGVKPVREGLLTL